jgi:hypothetical protein
VQSRASVPHSRTGRSCACTACACGRAGEHVCVTGMRALACTGMRASRSRSGCTRRSSSSCGAS